MQNLGSFAVEKETSVNLPPGSTAIIETQLVSNREVETVRVAFRIVYNHIFRHSIADKLV